MAESRKIPKSISTCKEESDAVEGKRLCAAAIEFILQNSQHNFPLDQ